MKIRLLDKDRRPVHMPEVSEVVIFDDDGNPVAASIQQGEFITSGHAAEADFDQTIRQCGLVPPEVKVLR